MSQYTSEYLSVNTARGAGNGLTTGTFLAYRLHGKAKKYGASYQRALINSLHRVGAVQGRSCRGGVAFYAVSVAEVK